MSSSKAYSLLQTKKRSALWNHRVDKIIRALLVRTRMLLHPTGGPEGVLVCFRAQARTSATCQSRFNNVCRFRAQAHACSTNRSPATRAIYQLFHIVEHIRRVIWHGGLRIKLRQLCLNHHNNDFIFAYQFASRAQP